MFPVPARSSAVVLCIDDEPVALQVRAAVLQCAGYRVLTAECGQAALDLFRSKHVDLVISDHLLKGETGTQIALEMKQIKPDVPIVILSGVTEIPSGIENADVFLSKTEHPSSVLATIAELIKRVAAA